MRLILASSSKYRQQILQKLQLSFESISPGIDENIKPNETAKQLVLRLAKEKALHVAKSLYSNTPNDSPNALIIASDQVAVLNDEILTKPLSFEPAMAQLKRCSGQTVSFLTSICLFNAATQDLQIHCEPYQVNFRKLEQSAIEAYLRRETPYDCAGSFKVESLGIVLFEKLIGDDPNTLIGLPLIRLIDMLEQQGIHVL